MNDAPVAREKPAANAPSARKEANATRRGHRAVGTFRVSHKGIRRTFGRHFGEANPAVETLAYHLAQVEATLPTVLEAIRLARYPNAGNRNPKRFALGLRENLGALEGHLRHANQALKTLARNGHAPPDDPGAEEE